MARIRVFPERTNFFAYFDDAAANAAEAARLLQRLFAGEADPEQAAARLRAISLLPSATLTFAP